MVGNPGEATGGKTVASLRVVDGPLPQSPLLRCADPRADLFKDLGSWCVEKPSEGSSRKSRDLPAKKLTVFCVGIVTLF